MLFGRAAPKSTLNSGSKQKKLLLSVASNHLPGGVMVKRKISARQIMSELRAGMTDRELMEKHNINAESLRYIFKRLVESGLITELQYYERLGLSESDLFRAFSDEPGHVLNCPRCGARLPEDGQECMFCKSVTLR